MQNLNQATRTYFVYRITYLVPFIVFLFTINPAFTQTQLPLPQEFQNISINAKALETTFDLNIDKNSSSTSQNFNLDNVGVILHLKPSPKIKDENIKIKIISNEGEEINVFNFIDNTLFALLDPQKSYSIIQEIKPDCINLADTFSIFKETALCPDVYQFKLKDNIAFPIDTSIKLRLKNPSEFYKLSFTLDENTNFFNNEDFKFIEVKTSEETPQITSNESTNIRNLLKLGKLCIVSSSKNAKSKIKINSCGFGTGIESIIVFENDFKEKLTASQNQSFIFPFLGKIFANLRHDLIFELSEVQEKENNPTEINDKSEKQHFLESSITNFDLKAQTIDPSSTRIKKNIFNLNNPLELNKELKKVLIKLPLEELEAIINLFEKDNAQAVLSSLDIIANEKNSNYLFKTVIKNNIVVKNLLDPQDDNRAETTRKLQQNIINPEVQILTYLPSSESNITLNKNYIFVEQTTAPSGDEKGKPIEIVNNKSKLDLIFLKRFENLNLTNQENSLTLNTEKSSKILENKNFSNPLSLSGFLVPPDQRPVLEDNYRATLELSMTINLTSNESVDIIYLDLMTKDETPLVNFFSFSFLPQGLYKAKVSFDGDREKLFKSAGVIKTQNNED